MNTSILKKGLLLAALALPLTALAQPGFGPRGDGACDYGQQRGPERGMRQMLRDLDLSDAQREQIRTIMDQQREARRAQAPAMREQAQAMRELIAAETLDEARLQELSAKQAELLSERIAQRVRMQHAILAVLTPQQREIVQQRLERRGEGFRARPPQGAEPAAPSGS